MATQPFNTGRRAFMLGQVDLVTDTIKCALMTPAYTQNIDTQEFWSDVSASEASGTGYTAGGLALTSKTVTLDLTNDRAVFDAADATWNPLTISTAGAVIYKDTGSAGTSRLLGYLDFGGTKAPSAQSWSVIFDATGIIRL